MKKGDGMDSGDMLIFPSGFSCIYGRQTLYFEDKEINKCSKIPPPELSDNLVEMMLSYSRLTNQLFLGENRVLPGICFILCQPAGGCVQDGQNQAHPRTGSSDGSDIHRSDEFMHGGFFIRF
jgi:hypothetical protein